MMAALDADVAVSLAGGELIHPESGVRDLAGGSDPKHYITSIGCDEGQKV